MSDAEKDGSYRYNKHLFGVKVDRHCDYCETGLRRSNELPEYDICPGCCTMFLAVKEQSSERIAVVDWLRAQVYATWKMADGLPWWRLRLRFANRAAAAACNKMARQIERGDHLKDHPGADA